MRVVATAGHVDHGKSTLVLALTGTDPDRFTEEKARGLTIDLGFAFTTLPSGIDVGFVDVPGHVRFVKNMLAGVGAVEIALLVVAANEGWMPQTAEHVAILELLDIRAGLVAVTKADLVDAETLELAQLELADHLDATDAGELARRRRRRRQRARTRRAARQCSTRCWRGRRTRSIPGARASGSTGSSPRADPAPSSPARSPAVHCRSTRKSSWSRATRAARVRRIESHGAHLERVGPGNRVALNLAGIEHDAVDAVTPSCFPGNGPRPRRSTWSCGPRLITSSPDAVRSTRTSDRANTTPRSASSTARSTSGGIAFGRLQLPVGLPLAPGDRLVLRSSARRATTGGAEVLDVAPTRRISDAPGRLALPLPERVLAARPWATAAELGPLAGVADGDGMGARAVRRGPAPRTSVAGS